ncbi:MAG: hypothetical protein K0Q66_1828 [Chitinophagaceae bacterium]|nr:hypothetical protein [Chitinophagaceae bacterium]
MNRLRNINVFVDGKKAGAVKNGSSEEFTVEPGSHQVECKIDWCACEPLNVELKENEVKILKLQSGLKYLNYFYIVIILVVIGRLFFRFSGQPMPGWYDTAVVVILVPSLVYLFYFLTVGKKKYLSLTEDKDSIFNN